MATTTRFKRWAAVLTVCAMTLQTAWPTVFTAPVTAQPATAQTAPELFVTEIHPDVDGADHYEFFEVYNNSNKPLALNDYTFLYRYTTGSTADKTFTFDDYTLAPQQTVVLWWNNTNKTLDEFNAKYGTSLSTSQVIEFDGFDGFSNSGDRGVVIRNKHHVEIASSIYLKADVGSGLGIHYKLAASGIAADKLYTKAAPTPGALHSGQIPAEPVMFPDEPINMAPTIAHTPITDGAVGTDLAVTARIDNAEQSTGLDTVQAAVYYRTVSQAVYASAPLTAALDSQYSGVIPKSALQEQELLYYIQAKDSVHTVTTDTYTVRMDLGAIDYNRMPHFLVTEVVPDSTNVNSADGYEFIEIYNNTNRDLNFKDYKLQYRYTDSGPEADVIWAGVPEELVVPSRGTLVFWVINGKNDTKTVADFNANYGSSLTENVDIVRVYSAGMANSGKRGLVVATNTRTELSAAYYETDEETKPDKGIFYKYPVDGGTTMIKYSAGLLPATPGVVSDEQVPPVTVKLTADTQKPTVTDITGQATVDQANDVDIVAEAKDDQSVKTVAFYFRSNADTAYTKRYLAESFADGFYHYKLYSPDLIGKSYYEYYFVVSDGTHEVTSETYRIQVTGGPDRSALRLNVADGGFVSGTYVLKATGEHAPAEELELSIDGTAITEDTYAALENGAYSPSRRRASTSTSRTV
ncbi:lamin tail domain-containing protein [Paenibacillus sp. YYML68]|uniref:lamin tail domain-containing protein n=1 Tax=Paenibacillus sp. YYML68 TaxID=2909250 RepID=UPI0024901582|nr:lamin tail domain-containing protein [Paenibacillus sp. YYML68]